MNSIDKNYLNLGYWFALFIVLTIAGFYPTYFGIWSLRIPSVVHLHAFFMIIWLGVIITQPILIKRKNYRLHRLIGRTTYVLVPLILITAYGMIRYAYFRAISALQAGVENGTRILSEDQIEHEARAYMALPVFYWLFFIIFYSLAILNRKRSMAHAQYMIAAALTLTGPTLDRILYNIFKSPKLLGIPIESYAFMLTLLILLLLIVYDVRKKYSVRTVSICLAIYLTGHILYFTATNSFVYHAFVKFLISPFS